MGRATTAATPTPQKERVCVLSSTEHCVCVHTTHTLLASTCFYLRLEAKYNSVLSVR